MAVFTFTSADVTGVAGSFTTGPTEDDFTTTDNGSSTVFGDIDVSGVDAGNNGGANNNTSTEFIFTQTGTLDVSSLPDDVFYSAVRMRVEHTVDVTMEATSPTTNHVLYNIKIDHSQLDYDNEVFESGTGNPANIADSFSETGTGADFDIVSLFPGGPQSKADLLLEMDAAGLLVGDVITLVLDVFPNSFFASSSGTTASADFSVVTTGWQIEFETFEAPTSGWYKSTHENLAEVAPVDFVEDENVLDPRNYTKIESIATGTTHFLGGQPCAQVGESIYYAGNDYEQGVDNPTLCKFDGQISTNVLALPFLTGTTPSQAILSICADTSGNAIYISTWDSGTDSSDFAGRVLVYRPAGGSLTIVDDDTFTGGKLPISMAFFNNSIYVGTSEVDPSITGEVVKLSLSVTPTLALVGSTYTYQVGAMNSTNIPFAAYIGRSAHITVKNRATLTGSAHNDLTWDNTIGALGYRVEREAGGATQGTIAGMSGATPTTFNDTGIAVVGGVPPDDSLTLNVNLTIATVPADATCTYRIGAVVDSVEYVSAPASITAKATLFSDLYVQLSWAAITGATAYKIYRTAGHTSTGLIATTGLLTLNDTGLVGVGSVPAEADDTSFPLTTGAVADMVVYDSNLYIASYQPSGTFGKVYKLTPAGVLTTSRTAAPGGTAQEGNGYTAGFVFDGNLYMGYWNDDATDIALIEKFNGSSWSTVSTISGAGARAWVSFCEADGIAYAYGGGDGFDGILYSSPDGTTWTDKTTLLPEAKEAIPFMGNVSVVGGF